MILNFVVRNEKFLMVDIAGAPKFCLPHCGFFNGRRLFIDQFTFGPRCEWRPQ